MAPFPEIECAPEETEAQRIGTGSSKAQTFPGAQWSSLGLTSGTGTHSVASWKAPSPVVEAATPEKPHYKGGGRRERDSTKEALRGRGHLIPAFVSF